MEQVWESLSVLWLSPLADTLATVLWGFFAGTVIAACYTVYRRRTLGGVLSALIGAEAFDEASAKTAEELGLGRIRRRALASRDRLIEETDGGRYFLPGDRREKADALLKSGKTPLWLVLLLILASYALMLALHAVIPWAQDLLQ